MNKKGNQQFQQTSQRIQAVTMALLEKESVQKITIRRICEDAGINRSTFYAHYLDLYDLLEKMNEAMTLRMVEATRPKDAATEKYYQEPFNWNFLEFIRENKTFYKAWMHYSPQGLFQIGGKNLLEHISERRMALGHITEPTELKYFNVYYSGGMNAILHLWLESDCQEDAQTIRELLKRCYPKQKSK